MISRLTGSMRLYTTYLNYHGFQANRINEVVYFVDLRTDIFYIVLHGEKTSTEMEQRYEGDYTKYGLRLRPRTNFRPLALLNMYRL